MGPTTRNSKIVKKRARSGRFQRRCDSILHETSSVQGTLFNFTSSKKISLKLKQSMMEEGMIDSKCRNICEKCIQCFTSKRSKTSSNFEIYNEIDDANDKSGTSMNSSSSSESCHFFEEDKDGVESEMNTLLQKCSDVGKFIRKAIKEDVSVLYNDDDKCKLNNLLQYNAKKWISQRPSTLTLLLCEILDIEVECMSECESLLLVKIIEQMYKMVNCRIILPVSFMENLTTYSLTHCRKIIGYNSKTTPAGSYTFLSQWMSEQANSPVNVPSGLIRCCFDNEQVVGKTRTVKVENKVPMSVVTSHSYISMDISNHSQSKKELKPSEWLFDVSINDRNALNTYRENHDSYFRDTRNKMIDECISSLLHDHGKLNNKDKDVIDTLVDLQEECEDEKICIECGSANDKTYRVCTDCGGKLAHKECQQNVICDMDKTYDPYKHFSENIVCKLNSATVLTGDPDFFNPNSYESVSQILRNLGKRVGIIKYGGTEREWIYIEVDGTIYVIVEKLIKNVFMCNVCKKSYYGNEHDCPLQNQKIEREFDWIVLVPGLLHVEMNMCKSFVDLNWDIFIQKCAFELGYKSPKSLEYARKCSDHHKTLKILEILYIGLTQELLVPFLQSCKSTATVPTVDSYWQWSRSIVNDNYNYLQDMVLTYLHSIMLFHNGIRKCNENAITAGMIKFSSFFFATNHPKYQRITAVDFILKTKMPVEVKVPLLSTLSVSRTGNRGHYQGGDACLEEINKEGKSWISQHGVPSNSEWLKVFRNIDDLVKLRNGLMSITGVEKGPLWSQSPVCSIKEVVAVRAVLRKCCSLIGDKDIEFKSFFGKPLNKRLLHFRSLGIANQTEYLENLLQQNDHTAVKLNVIKDVHLE